MTKKTRKKIKNIKIYIFEIINLRIKYRDLLIIRLKAIKFIENIFYYLFSYLFYSFFYNYNIYYYIFKSCN